MTSYFMKMTTKIDAANSIPSNAASFGDSRQTDDSDITFFSDKKKRAVAMMAQEKQKGHLNKPLPIPKRRRLTKHVGLDKVFPKRRALPASSHQRIRGDIKSRPSCVYCA